MAPVARAEAAEIQVPVQVVEFLSDPAVTVVVVEHRDRLGRV